MNRIKWINVQFICEFQTKKNLVDVITLITVADQWKYVCLYSYHGNIVNILVNLWMDALYEYLWLNIYGTFIYLTSLFLVVELATLPLNCNLS